MSAEQNLGADLELEITPDYQLALDAVERGDPYIFISGKAGTGKTTLANLLIKAIGGEDAIFETKECDELMSIKDLKHYLFRAGNIASMTSSKKHFLLFEHLKS